MKAILIDDEPLALKYLKRQLEKVGNLTVTNCLPYFNIRTDQDKLSAIDVVFLDIEMPEINGLELAEKIVEVNPDVAIVFVTAYNEYAVEAFELNALDYIVKPVQLARLQTTIKRLEASYEQRAIQSNTQSQYLQINISGDITIIPANGELYPLNWRTAKAEELFLYLLESEGETIHKSALVELLWPDYEPEKAYSHLYTTVYHVRKTIAPFRDYIGIHSKQGGYVMFLSNVTVDTWEWEKAMQSLPEINAYTISDYERAMDMLKGTYLGGRDYIWAEPEGYRFEQIWLQYAYQIAQFYETNDNTDAAQSWYNHILDIAPEAEHAAFALMTIYANYGYDVLVLHQYEALAKNLEQIDVTMDSEIDKWFGEWKANRNRY